MHTGDSTTDQQLIRLLTEGLDCPVKLEPPGAWQPTSGDLEHSSLTRRAAVEPGRLQQSDPASEISILGPEASAPDGRQASDQQANVVQAIGLPNGAVAHWTAPASAADQLGRHAETILELAKVRNQRDQLNREVESLTVQVMQDFEELSLIRSLSSSLELPQTAEATDDFVLKSLVPLAAGVGAVSIAIVLCEDEQPSDPRPLWTGPSVLSDASVRGLIAEYSRAAKTTPIVRNECFGDRLWGEEGLKELVIVECASKGRRHGWLLACNRIQDDLGDDPWIQRGFTTVHASLMETASNQLAAHLHTSQLLKQKEELFTDVIRALVNAIEARDPYTSGHSERVACFAKLIATHLGFTPAECERLYLTGLLHDVGKIAIPDVVLRKPTQLNDHERSIIETHTDFGWRILHEVDALQHVLPGVLYHHERWDGYGYPDKLAGDNIPIDGRILAVCDAFDAMTSDRPYRGGMSVPRCLQIMKNGAGKIWDPNLVSLFLENIDEIKAIRSSHRPRRHARRPAPVDGVPRLRDSAPQPWSNRTPLAPTVPPSPATGGMTLIP